MCVCVCVCVPIEEGCPTFWTFLHLLQHKTQNVLTQSKSAGNINVQRISSSFARSYESLGSPEVYETFLKQKGLLTWIIKHLSLMSAISFIATCISGDPKQGPDHRVGNHWCRMCVGCLDTYREQGKGDTAPHWRLEL